MFELARLRAQGAPGRRFRERGVDFVARALREGPFIRDRHPGCLAYVWPVGTERRQTTAGLPKALTYPKAEALSESTAWSGMIGRTSGSAPLKDAEKNEATRNEEAGEDQGGCTTVVQSSYTPPRER